MTQPSPYLLLLRRVALAAILMLVAACGSEQAAESRLEEARTRAAGGDLAGALIQYKALLADHPDLAAARLEFGRLYVLLGDGRSALKEIERARELVDAVPERALEA